MDNAPSRIVELFQTFDDHIEAYHSQQYNETQLRREFIDHQIDHLVYTLYGLTEEEIAIVESQD